MEISSDLSVKVIIVVVITKAFVDVTEVVIVILKVFLFTKVIALTVIVIKVSGDFRVKGVAMTVAIGIVIVSIIVVVNLKVVVIKVIIIKIVIATLDFIPNSLGA